MRLGLYEGYVAERNDPEGRGRIKVRVPGLLEPSDWVEPYGLYDSTLGRGVWFIPKLNTTVNILFLQGENLLNEAIRYVAGGTWGLTEGAPDVPIETENGDPDIVVFGFDGFALVVDERDGQGKATLVDRTNGSFMRLNTETGDILIQSVKNATIENTLGAKVELKDTGEARMTAVSKAIMTGALQEIGLGATEAAVLGTVFTTLFNAHTQVVTAGGVAGPPTTPMIPGIHTSLVTTIG